MRTRTPRGFDKFAQSNHTLYVGQNSQAMEKAGGWGLEVGMRAEFVGTVLFAAVLAFAGWLIAERAQAQEAIEAEDKDASRYRRAMYTFRFRSLPYPVLQTFDAPNGDFACVRRSRSNTPLQALMTLNEPIFVECAQGLAVTTLRNGGATDADRLAYAFRRCVSRSPSETERAELSSLLNRQVERYSQPDAKPQALLVDELPGLGAAPEGTTPAQLAAWTVVSRVLLNLDETITKE